MDSPRLFGFDGTLTAGNVTAQGLPPGTLTPEDAQFEDTSGSAANALDDPCASEDARASPDDPSEDKSGRAALGDPTASADVQTPEDAQFEDTSGSAANALDDPCASEDARADESTFFGTSVDGTAATTAPATAPPQRPRLESWSSFDRPTFHAETSVDDKDTPGLRQQNRELHAENQRLRAELEEMRNVASEAAETMALLKEERDHLRYAAELVMAQSARNSATQSPSRPRRRDSAQTTPKYNFRRDAAAAAARKASPPPATCPGPQMVELYDPGNSPLFSSHRRSTGARTIPPKR